MIDPSTSFFDPKISRRKTVFVIHAFESALFNFVCDNTISLDELPSGVVAAIKERAARRGADLSSAGVPELLENAYLDEIFESAQKACGSTDASILLKALRSKCHEVELFDIRNACAHPTREFPVFYWYRMASIACDPLISLLRLGGVQEALVSAEDDRISDPPHEWLDRFRFALPNNLPQSDHEITGLVGREKDAAQLIEKLRSPGITRIAITGYGGIGKTALVLQVMSRICADRTQLPEIDGVIYVTLKEEHLTAAGIVEVGKVRAAIKDEVASALVEAGITETAGDFDESVLKRRLILCIDNAETLLKEEDEGLTGFLDSVPATWKIILTSRLVVDGARTIPVAPLGQSHAEFLARKYASSKGLSASPDLPRIVAKSSRGNPLCIRLIIDRIGLGNAVEDAVSSSNDDLVNFSFNHLLEALPSASLKVLEALYLTKASGRRDLADILQIPDDELVLAIRMLQRTSLVLTSVDSEGNELLSVNEAISELFVLHPKLAENRQEIESRLRAREQRVQAQMDHQDRFGIDPWHWNYIPTDLPAALKDLLIEANRLLGQNDWGNTRGRLGRLAGKLASAESAFSTFAYYWKSRARVLERLGDPSAEHAFRRSIELSTFSAPSVILYATYLSRHGRCRDAYDQLHPVIESGLHLDTQLDIKTRRGIVYNYTRSLRDLDRFDQVIEFAQSLGLDSDLLGGFAPMLISALRQCRSASVQNSYSKCFDVVKRCVTAGYFSSGLVEETAKVLETALRDKESGVLSSEWDEVVRFAAEMRPLLSRVRNDKFEPERFVEICTRILGDEAAPLSNEEATLIARGYLDVYVHRIPSKVGSSWPSFIFCRSRDFETFFCHKSSLEGDDVSLWQDLSVYDRIFVLPEEVAAEGKFRKSLSTVVLAV